jgi:hypothetical protein
MIGSSVLWHWASFSSSCQRCWYCSAADSANNAAAHGHQNQFSSEKNLCIAQHQPLDLFLGSLSHQTIRNNNFACNTRAFSAVGTGSRFRKMEALRELPIEDGTKEQAEPTESVWFDKFSARFEEKILWTKACLVLDASIKGVGPFVRSVMERLHRRVIAKVKLDIMADLGVCDVEDWDCSTCSDADNSTYTEDCPVSLAIRSIDANGVADCGTVHNLKFMTFHPCFVKIGPARRDDPLILCPYPTHIYEPRSSQVIFMEQIDLDSSVACLQPFRVTRVTPGQPDLEFLAVFCHGCPGDVRISVSQHLEGHRSSGSRRFWALTNKNKKINPSYPSAFIEMRHGLRRGHTVLFHRDASILPSGIEEGRLYIVNNALKFSFSVCGPILKLNDADVVIRRSPVGRYVSALLCARTWRSHVDT